MLSDAVGAVSSRGSPLYPALADANDGKLARVGIAGRGVPLYPALADVDDGDLISVAACVRWLVAPSERR